MNMSFFNNKYFDLPTQYALLFNNTTELHPKSKESVIRAHMALQNNNSIITERDDDMLVRIAKSAYREMFESDRGQELICKATKYNISYNKSRIDWLTLIDNIQRYEQLINEAEELGIHWEDINDPVYLEQEIEEVRHQASIERNDMISSFFASRGVEV
jgi:hypothetical protein